MSRTVALGFGLALLGSCSAAAGMNLMKASDLLERDQPLLYKRRLILGIMLGIGVNAVLDCVAFALAPLSLMAPLSGVSIVVSVLLARLGFAGMQESLSRLQLLFISVVLCGVTLASSFGPHPEANLDLHAMRRHFFDPRFLTFFLCSLAGICGWFCVWFLPCCERIRPERDSLATTIIAGIGAGLASAQTQMLLKVVATAFRASMTQSVDLRHHPIVLLCGCMLPCFATAQLYLLNSTLASCEVALAVPFYSSAIILTTVAVGALFFHELAHLGSTELSFFICGTLLVVVGLSGLTRLRAQAQHEKDLAIAESEGYVLTAVRDCDCECDSSDFSDSAPAAAHGSSCAIPPTLVLPAEAPGRADVSYCNGHSPRQQGRTAV